MAVKVTGVPLGVDVIFGVILIPVSTSAVTVRLAPGEKMPLFEAVIVVVLPGVKPVATPVVLLMVAILESPATQAT